MICLVQVYALLSPLVTDPKSSLDIIAFAALSLGIIYVGSCHDGVAQAIIIALMERSEAELGDPLARFLCLGLGLLYLGKQVLTALLLIIKICQMYMTDHC